MAETKPKTTPRDALRMVFRRRLMFVGGAILFALAALVGACWWPLKYTGTAKLERRMDVAAEESRSKSESFEAVKRMLQQELGGPNAIAEAIEELERQRLVDPLPRGKDGKLTSEGLRVRQEMVAALAADLKVTFDVNSPEVDIVKVEFTHPDPNLAQEFPNVIVTKYISRVGTQIVDNLTASRDFLRDKVAIARSRLDEFTRKRLDFEKEHAGALPDNAAVLQERLQQLAASIDTTRGQLVLAQQKLGQIRALKASPVGPGGDKAPAESAPKGAEKKEGAGANSPEPVSVDQVRDLERRYADAAHELAGLVEQQAQTKRALDEAKTLNHMTDQHPKVKALKKQFDDLDKRIAALKTTVADLDKQIRDAQGALVKAGERLPESLASPANLANPFMARQMELQEATLAIQEASSQAEVQMHTNELERLQARLKVSEDAWSRLGAAKQEYMEIIKNVAEQQGETDRWQKRLTDVEMDLAAEAAKHRTRLRQVVLAEEQFVPSSPKLLYVLVLALVGGLAFGGGLVFLSHTMDRSVTTTEDAAHFGLPVFGIIAEIETPREKARKRLLRWGVRPLVLLVAAVALAVAALNITLWLQYREDYEQWRKAPASFVAAKAADAFQALKQRAWG